MDIYHVALVVGEAIVSGLLIFKAIDLAKLSSVFPWFTAERVTLIRAVNLALSTLSVVLIAFANHALGIMDFQNFVQAALAVGVAWSTAHATHKMLKPDVEPVKEVAPAPQPEPVVDPVPTPEPTPAPVPEPGEQV